MTESVEIVPKVDLTRLEQWLDEKGIGAGSITDVVRLSGGTQNILFRFCRGDRTMVLRRGPENLREESNRVIQREAQLLSAFRGTGVPHPPLVASSPSADILGASFYVTDFVDGFNATLNPPAELRESADFRHMLGLELIRGLAKLAAVDPASLGLSDFGRLEDFLKRQTGRWAHQLESYARYPEWTGNADLPGIGEIAAWLDANLPPTMQPGIIHGDYHLGNVIFGHDGRLKAIADWEMATLGDPLLDLGRVLSTWPDEEGNSPLSLRVEPVAGFPSRSELIKEYERLTGRDMTHLRWFEILSCYKLGIILEGTYARAQAGLADMATGKRLHESAIALLRRGLGWTKIQASTDRGKS